MRLIASLILSAIAGLVVSWEFFHGQVSVVPAATSLVPHAMGAVGSVEMVAGASGTMGEKVQKLLVAIQRKGSSSTRENEMYLAIAALTAEDFRRLVSEQGALKVFAEKIQDTSYTTIRPLASALIARWLAVDPDGFTTWAPRLLDGVPAKGNLRAFFLEALFSKRPEEILSLVPSWKDASARGEIIAGALCELATHHLAKARAWLERCTDPADQLAGAKALRMGMALGDPLQAIELAKSVENRREADQLLALAGQSAAKMGAGVLRQLATTPMPPWMAVSLINSVGQKDPELAVELALKTTTEVNAPYIMRNAFSLLTQRDPSLAIAKLDSLSGVQRASAIAGIGLEWSASDPVAALTWMSQLSAEDRKDPNGWNSDHDSLLSAFGSWVGGDKSAARTWADALPAGALRDATQKQLARALAAQGDAIEASQVLAQFGDSADPKIVSEVATAWARRDPKAAADWAIAQPAGAAQGAAIASVVGAWANDDPSGVATWLGQFPPGEAKDRSIVAYLSRNSTWASPKAERLAEFDTWFDSISDPWQRAHAAAQAFLTKKQSDSAAAKAWLSSLPNVDPEVIQMTLRSSRR